MIKDRKDRNEKPGSNTGSKGDVPLTVPPSRSCETIPEEESATKSHGTVNVIRVEEGEIVKKNGATNTNTMSSCVHEPLLGSTNVGRRGGPISMVSIHTPSSGTGAGSGPGDLCLLETAQEDGCEGVPPINLPMSSSTGPPPNGVQSLPSNVINKQPGTMEAQYMQQQSLIFVFSTNLANKSAEAVLRGHFPSIIAYHYTQPGTKKYLEACNSFRIGTRSIFLNAEKILSESCWRLYDTTSSEKQPLKMNQFTRQNPDQWVNGLAQMKQKVGPNLMKALNTIGLSGSNEMGPNPNSTGGMEMWTQANIAQPPLRYFGEKSTTTISSVGPTSNRQMEPQPCPVSNRQVRGGPKRIPPSGGMDSPCMSSGSPNPNTLLSGGGGHHSPSMAQTTPGGMISDMVGSPGINLQPSLTELTNEDILEMENSIKDEEQEPCVVELIKQLQQNNWLHCRSAKVARD
uniref:Uncharacterized protein n=1 Tax=Timema cristinae TaxID=61476 RepID=A0A7R9H852_TIMCR|nr:unnamed protein product [Timema cristinae]